MTASTLKFTAKLARSLAAVFCVCTAIFSQSTVALATPARRCSRDTFSIGGQPMKVTVCVGAVGDRETVEIYETLRSPKGSFTHNCWIDILPGAPESIGVDDVSLSPLGLPDILHLTLALRDGAITIEHARLLPGGVPLK